MKYCYKGKKYADLDAKKFLARFARLNFFSVMGEKNMILERGGGKYRILENIHP